MFLVSAFKLYREQRIRAQAVFVWAEKHLKEGELFVVSIKGFARQYAMRDSRLSTDRSPNPRIPAVIACEPKDLPLLTRWRTDGWSLLFRSPIFEVWENTGRFSGNIPARHGLSEENSTALLAIARKVLFHKVKTGNKLPLHEFSNGLESFAEDTVSADVAVWINGELRASMIVAEKPLVEAVIEAAIRAASDARFRPLEKNELENARLELTIWSDLEIPLLPLEIARGDIYHTKAYIARKDSGIGWYLPIVFNSARFTNLVNLLDALARNKGGFQPNGAQFFLVETHGWIESDNKIKVLTLRGPIVASGPIQESICLAIPKIIESATRSADWLVSLQEQNGHIESIIDPLESYPSKGMQWARDAFSAYALASFGREMGHSSYVNAAKFLFAYLSQHIQRATLSGVARVSTEAYLGRTAKALSMETEARQFADIVARNALMQVYDPILYLQSSAFLYTAGDEYRAKSEELYRIIAGRFLSAVEHDRSLSLASYAELAVLSSLFGDTTVSERVEQWYKDLQHADGSFPNTPSSTFAYTRGTGKIFEVMANDPERYHEQLQKSASWIMDMQYDKENSYFVPDIKKRDMLLGGFRHDAGNQQAWADAAAHFIIGAARLRSRCLFG